MCAPGNNREREEERSEERDTTAPPPANASALARERVAPEAGVVEVLGYFLDLRGKPEFKSQDMKNAEWASTFQGLVDSLGAEEVKRRVELAFGDAYRKPTKYGLPVAWAKSLGGPGAAQAFEGNIEKLVPSVEPQPRRGAKPQPKPAEPNLDEQEWERLKAENRAQLKALKMANH